MSMIKVEKKLNKSTLTVDGQISSPMLYGLSDFPAAASFTAQAQRNIKAFRKAGIKIVNVDSGLHRGWFKHDSFDPEPVVAEIANALEAAPDIKVMVRLHMNPPYWWLRDHPEECIVYRSPEGDYMGIDNGEQDRLIANDQSNHMRVSLASERWLSEAGEKLGILCDTLANSPEGDALFGIQIACGVYGEWHYWGIDVSEPMKKRFRKFLSDKYENDEALRKSWNMSDVTVESAEFHPEYFAPADEGNFSDPRKSRYIMDAQECHQITSTDAILYFAKIIKSKMPNVLTGAFYGYYWGTNDANVVRDGHLMVDKLYENPELVNFLCGPFCYMENRKANGVPMQRGMLESNRLRGVLWLTEMDQHPEGADAFGCCDREQLPQTIAILRRNVLQTLCSGQGLWFYDHRVIPQFRPGARVGGIYRKRGWWEEPELMEQIEKLKNVGDVIASKPYKPAADVLVVSNTKSYFCRTNVRDYEYRIHESIARCGVSYDLIYLHELEMADISRYKCVIFTNAYMITPEMREKCKKLLCDTYTVWLYASGYCDGETLALENLSETVGINIKKTQDVKRIAIKDGDISIGDTVIRMEKEEVEITDDFSPAFAVNDDAAVKLATYDNGETAAAISGKNVWIGLPLLTKKIMEPIMKLSGAHCYCSSANAVIAGADIVAINCPDGGHHTVVLKNGKSVEVDLDGPATVAFDAESGKRVL